MKKILQFSLVAIILSNTTFAATPHDVEMDDAQQSTTFDMTELQSAIDAIAYNNPTSNLPYFDNAQNNDFIREIFKRYSALQHDLTQLQQAISPADFERIFLEINKAITSLISCEDALKFTYLTVTQKLNSEQDVTPAMIAQLAGYIKSMPTSDADNALPKDPEMLKSIFYKIVKIRQEKRESFYKLLLTKPHLKIEYQAVLNGQKLDLSDDFLHELIKSIADSLKNGLIMDANFKIQETLASIVTLTPEDKAQIEAQITAQIEAETTQMTAQITSEITSKRIGLCLMLKHFGEISGLGSI